MNKLYVFAIGGSGERVMKSLVMMLAAGMPLGAKELVPVFVDNDVKSNALTSCLDLIDYYRADPKESGVNLGLHALCRDNNFGQIPTFAHVKIDAPIVLNVAGNQIGTLDRIIGKLNDSDPVESAIKEEKDLLFTKDDLEMPLTVGFVGNPNIGSVVLNSLSLQSENFQTIYGDAATKDGVFVIGSLFGGTGAAGFPLIINKFRSNDNTHCPLLGGVAVLPYFNIEEGDETNGLLNTEVYDVHSNTFNSKTRAALMYYDEYMRDMDYMYYVGDNMNPSQYKHYVGGEKQENPYNIIEVMAALSVVDFSKKDVDAARGDVVYEIPVFGINENGICNLSGIYNPDLKRALVKFQLMKVMFEGKDFLKWNIDQNHKFTKEILFTKEMRKAVVNKSDLQKYPNAWGLANMFEQWDKWMKEMGDRNVIKRPFRIFDATNEPLKNNVTQNFYTDNENGIAKTETEREIVFGIPPRYKDKILILSPDIEDAMNKIKLEVKSSISSDKALANLLVTISKALDNVIDNNCNLL